MKTKKVILNTAGFILACVFIYLVFLYFEPKIIQDMVKVVKNNPYWLFVLFFIYGLSFFVKAYSWWLYIKKEISFKTCLIGIWYSLFINHIVPFKLGDLARIAVAAKTLSYEKAFHSVIVLRTLDLMVLMMIGSIGVTMILGRLPIKNILILSIGIGCLVLLGLWFNLKFRALLKKHLNLVGEVLLSANGLAILLLTIASWMLEGIVVYVTAIYFFLDLTFIEAVWINSLTVVGGLFQIAPGGLATYETTMSMALFSLGISLKTAIHIAIISHGFKFLFSYAVGVYVIISSPLSLSNVWKRGRKNK